MNFHLPGLFERNPVDIVNYSLWTVPYEFACYGLMSAFIVFGTLRKPALVISVAVFVSLVGIVLVSVGVHPLQATPGIFNKISYFFFTDRGSRLFVAFALGIAAYLLRYRILFSLPLFVLSVLLCGAVAALVPADW